MPPQEGSHSSAASGRELAIAREHEVRGIQTVNRDFVTLDPVEQRYFAPVDFNRTCRQKMREKYKINHTQQRTSEDLRV
jgi:hypothetical protein